MTMMTIGSMKKATLERGQDCIHYVGQVIYYKDGVLLFRVLDS